MTIQEAIERLNKEKEQLNDAIECSLSGISERNDWGGLVQAIDTVLAELKESKKEGKWKPKSAEEYWFRDISGGYEFCYRDEGDGWDDWRVNNIPIFKTREECVRYWHFMDAVKEKSYEFSREEWKDWGVEKHYISYDFENECFDVYANDIAKDLGVVHFKTEEDAQYIIDNFKEELLKYWL